MAHITLPERVRCMDESLQNMNIIWRANKMKLPISSNPWWGLYSGETVSYRTSFWFWDLYNAPTEIE
jgi:hypothetical protein